MPRQLQWLEKAHSKAQHKESNCPRPKLLDKFVLNYPRFKTPTSCKVIHTDITLMRSVL